MSSLPRCGTCRRRISPSNCCANRSEEHTSELQSRLHLVCRLLLEKKKENEELTAPVNIGGDGAFNEDELFVFNSRVRTRPCDVLVDGDEHVRRKLGHADVRAYLEL